MHPHQPKRKRGGQPGNTNALKHGRRSGQLRRFVALLAADPEASAVFARFARLARRPAGLAGYRAAMQDYERMAEPARLSVPWPHTATLASMPVTKSRKREAWLREDSGTPARSSRASAPPSARSTKATFTPR